MSETPDKVFRFIAGEMTMKEDLHSLILKKQLDAWNFDTEECPDQIYPFCQEDRSDLLPQRYQKPDV